MPPKLDLVFNSAPNDVETNHTAFNVKLSPTKLAQDLSHTYRPSAPIIEDWVSDYEDESETKTSQIVPSFVQSTEHVKSPRHSVQHVKTSIPAATLKPASPNPTSNGKRRNRKACFVCKSLDYLIKDCDYHEKQMAKPTARNHAHRGNHKHYAYMPHQNLQKHMVHAAVLTQSKPVPITVVKPVSTIVPKINMTKPKQVKPIVTKTNSPKRRYKTRSPSPKVSNSPLRVTAVKAPVVNAAQGMQGNWKWRPKCLILDHVSRNTSASMTLKRFDYNDAQDEAVHKELDDRLVRAATTTSSLEAECQETMKDTTAQTRFESVSKHSNDSLLVKGNTLQSDEDSLKLNELMELCTSLQNKVLDLENTKTSQCNKIDSLKRRVKKLEKRNRPRTHKLKRLYKVGLTTKVESSKNEESLDDLGGEEEFVAEQEAVSIAATTKTITTEEITLAQVLEALKKSKP
nr:hypothetical protein [Tanacetum cinerariifolium]